jgi:hypothetical protein
MKVTPCPSPRGTNHENLYLVKLPRNTPAGALDAALRRAKDRKVGRDEEPEQERDLVKLRGRLEEFLSRVLPDSHYQSACDLMTEAGLPEGQTYGEVDDEDPDEEEFRSKYPDHIADTVRRYMEGKGFSEDEIQEAISSSMPKNAIEDRRGARDRGRRHAMDSRSAADRFEEMFGASRIGSTNSFR